MGLFDNKNAFTAQCQVKSKLVYGSNNNNRNPLVSILMPIYNHPRYFEKALLSAINQDCDFEYEIVVCDNNHPEYQEQNQAIVEKINSNKVFYYVNEENIGGINNWNRCIRLAKASDVTFCHDDDMLMPSALSYLKSIRSLVSDKKVLIVGLNNCIDKNDQIISETRHGVSDKVTRLSLLHFFASNYTNGCGSLYSKESLIEIGGFSADYNPCPDYALNVKYCHYYNAVLSHQVTFLYRITNESDSATCYPLTSKASLQIRKNIIATLSKGKIACNHIAYCLEQQDVISGKIKWSPDSLSLKEKWLSIYFRLVIKSMNLYLTIIAKKICTCKY